VKYYFYKWRDDGTDQTIHDLLRWQVREKRGRLADPSLVVLDTQSLHAAAGVPAETTGRDANKKVPGRKRGRPTGLRTHVQRRRALRNYASTRRAPSSRICGLPPARPLLGFRSTTEIGNRASPPDPAGSGTMRWILK
jgi:hypothetical protein